MVSAEVNFFPLELISVNEEKKKMISKNSKHKYFIYNYKITIEFVHVVLPI